MTPSKPEAEPPFIPLMICSTSFGAIGWNSSILFSLFTVELGSVFPKRGFAYICKKSLNIFVGKGFSLKQFLELW